MGFRLDYAYYWPKNLAVRQIGEYWVISLTDRPFNVVHGDTGACSVYETKEQAIEAAKHISALRAVKYV